uniref:MADF domain-containing protein n=1 Tax=Anopheles christyi TaxID=43041 RepID=A0A182K1Y8_9DIPT
MQDKHETCKPNFVEEFIELYKSFPCLWHRKSNEYEQQKQRAYDALVQKYREVDPQANKETVKRKINALRTGYRKQLRRLNRPSRAGTSNSQRQPTWWYFQLFDFLDDYPSWLKQDGRQVDSTHVVSQESDEELTDDIEGSLGQQQHTTSSQWNESCSSSSQQHSEPTETAQRRTGSASARNEYEVEEVMDQKLNDFLQHDPSIVYGKHVANKLRSLNDMQNKFAQKLINDIIFEAEMGSLTRDCTLAGMTNVDSHILVREVITQRSLNG